MRSSLSGLSAAATVILLAATASADPISLTASAPDQPTYAMGARIGGYGFRREGDSAFTGKWDECRMNGVGIFANRTLRGPFFIEAALDTYFSTEDKNPMDLPVDRQSALISTAIGARMNLTTWLDGFIQLGFGAELAKLSVPYGDDQTLATNKIMPEGFFGVGGDIRITKSMRIGASIRTLVMGNFNYDPQRLDKGSQAWTSTPTADQVFAASPSLVAQGQFFLEHDL
ncbi:MAG: hypothetical protein QM831_10140 [Kofleriaceae bacterium]